MPKLKNKAKEANDFVLMAMWDDCALAGLPDGRIAWFQGSGNSLSLVVEVANMVKEANMVEAVQVRSSTV